jgi:hypothetical protein
MCPSLTRNENSVPARKSHVYIFVRRDLPPSQIVVQASHAAFEAASLRTPDLDHPHFVLLGFKNQRELERALNRVQSSGFQVRPFYEADRENELTAFATQPIFEPQRSFFRRYNCLSDELLFSGFL